MERIVTLYVQIFTKHFVIFIVFKKNKIMFYAAVWVNQSDVMTIITQDRLNIFTSHLN